MEARSEERKIWQRIGGQQVKPRNARIGTTNRGAEEKAKEYKYRTGRYRMWGGGGGRRMNKNEVKKRSIFDRERTG